MKHTIKKAALVVFLTVLWSLLAGCATQSYEELEAEYTITGDRSKLERRERELLTAEDFFRSRDWCLQAQRHTWVCLNVHSGSRLGKGRNVGENRTIDGTIRQYRLERANGCGCADQAAMRRLMRDLERQLGK